MGGMGHHDGDPAVRCEQARCGREGGFGHRHVFERGDKQNEGEAPEHLGRGALDGEMAEAQIGVPRPPAGFGDHHRRSIDAHAFADVRGERQQLIAHAAADIEDAGLSPMGQQPQQPPRAPGRGEPAQRRCAMAPVPVGGKRIEGPFPA